MILQTLLVARAAGLVMGAPVAVPVVHVLLPKLTPFGMCRRWRGGGRREGGGLYNGLSQNRTRGVSLRLTLGKGTDCSFVVTFDFLSRCIFFSSLRLMVFVVQGLSLSHAAARAPSLSLGAVARGSPFQRIVAVLIFAALIALSLALSLCVCLQFSHCLGIGPLSAPACPTTPLRFLGGMNGHCRRCTPILP